jgi:5-methylthioadenosine/S-adenosylhomocysteine deaminase
MTRRRRNRRMRLITIGDSRMTRRLVALVLYLRFCVLVCTSVFSPLAEAAPAKQRADLLVWGGTVVTMDAGRRVLEDGGVAIRGDTIVAVGPRAELEERFDAARRIDAQGKIVLPGLINGHTHAAMVLLRGIADDLALNDWLQKYIFPAEARNVTEDFVLWGTRLGVLEMLRGGITTYVDMYYFEDAVARVSKEAGMRGVLGETIIDFPAPDNKSVPQALAYTEDFLKRWKGDPLVVAAIAPHSIYTCSEKTLQDSAALARKYGAPILIHVAEASFEAELSRAKHGMSPVAYLENIGVLGPDMVAAHCIWVDGNDMRLLARREVGCVHNPASNMKLASGVMPVVDLLAAGVRLGLGTDGAASNNDLDEIADMRLAGLLQKSARGDPRALPAQQVVEMATIGGARALHLEKEIGSLEAGKKADLILISVAQAHATPLYNVYSQLVYALQASDVETVVIAGRPVMENRRMLTLNEDEILAKARAYAKKIEASLAPPAK